MHFTRENLPPVPKDCNSAFPSHLLDPKRKDRKWHLQYSKAMYYQTKNNQGYFNNDRKGDWLDARLYADGNQNVDKYHKWASRLTNDKGQTVSYMDLNWKIVSPIPKFMAVLKGYFNKLDYKIQATSINPEATDDKKKIEASIWASKQLKPFFDELEKIAGQSFGENPIIPFVPDSKEELEMFFKLSYSDQAEIAMILAQRMVFHENEWKDKVAPELWDDVMRIAALGTCTWIDRIGKRLKIRYCDPINMVLDNFRGHDGESMERIGEFYLRTVAQLKLEFGTQFSEEEYYDIAFNHRGRYGNPDQLTPYADYINSDASRLYCEWDNYQVLVMEWYTDSCDRLKHEKKPVKGVDYFFPKDFKTPLGKKQVTDEDGKLLYEKEVVATDVKTVYGGKWIVGTNYIADWGKITDISRPKENPKDCIKPMKFYRITNQSIVEQMIPFEDSYMLSWLKIQNLKARALPKGIMIEIGAFENVALDGKIMSAKELIEIAIQSGIIIYRKNSTIDDENYDTQRPIEETEGGMGKEFNELIQSMANDLMSMREVAGISQMFDASQQNPRQPVENAQLAVQGTENALAPMVKGFMWMMKKVAIDVCLKLQMMAQYMDIEGYAPAIGTAAIERIKIGKEITNTTYGIELEALPTKEQIDRLLAAAKAALESPNDPSKGGIDFADYLQIEKWATSGNFELADKFFIYKIKKFKEEAAKQAADNIKNQGEQNKQLEQTKIEGAAKMKEIETKGEMDVDDRKTANKMKLLDREYQLKKELLGIEKRHDQAEEHSLEKTAK